VQDPSRKLHRVRIGHYKLRGAYDQETGFGLSVAASEAIAVGRIPQKFCDWLVYRLQYWGTWTPLYYNLVPDYIYGDGFMSDSIDGYTERPEDEKLLELFVSRYWQTMGSNVEPFVPNTLYWNQAPPDFPRCVTMQTSGSPPMMAP